jgi:5-methylthioadenosine/S-adenosylhomocysteine deaminase
MKAETRVDAKGKAALPGMINCHTHVPMTLFRGIAEDQSLDTWLKKNVWPLEAHLKPEDIYAGALLGCLEMIKSGTTCFADMYFHEDRVAGAVEKSGLRSVLAEGIIEAGDRTQGERMFAQSVSFARSFSGRAKGRITTMLGPHAAYSCGPDLLSRVTEMASKLGYGVHLHMAESQTTFQGDEKKQNLSEVEYLDKLGFLKGHVLAAHCINLSRRDMRTISDRGVNVAYVPVANMKLGMGAAKIKELVDLGVTVGLGTDGPASNNSLDMFETMKFGALLQKLTYTDPAVASAYEVLRMATTSGAEALRLGDYVGSLEVGKRADIILVDLIKPHLSPLHDIFANIVYSARGSDVDTVIVDGRVLMQNRRVNTLNETDVMKKAEHASFDLLHRAHS